MLLEESIRSRGIGLRCVLHRILTYPFLLPIAVAYNLNKDSRFLDLFYTIRSIPHGIPYNGGLRLANYGKKRFIFPCKEDPNFDDVFLRNVYYPYKPQKKDIVVDVGAHMGFFTVKVASHVSKVVSIEPDPYNFKFLSKNIAYNSLKNVAAFNYALGDRDCIVSLKRSYGHGRTTLVEISENRQYIKMKRLDTLIKEERISPSFIKIDTEGYEMRILEGAKFTLASCNSKLLIAAYHYENEWKEVSEFLLQNGFRCFIYQVPLTLQMMKETYIYAIPC